LRKIGRKLAKIAYNCDHNIDPRIFKGGSGEGAESTLVGDEVLAFVCNGSADTFENRVYVATSGTNTVQVR
jgi:hypothetical protein